MVPAAPTHTQNKPHHTTTMVAKFAKKFLDFFLGGRGEGSVLTKQPSRGRHLQQRRKSMRKSKSRKENSHHSFNKKAIISRKMRPSPQRPHHKVNRPSIPVKSLFAMLCWLLLGSQIQPLRKRR
ncbi:hypothetical protein niasHT_035904 [Heterodera trifolii]|uniref:Uncharacterized protein n=1 Tax=Heterodera trifolii TaxID=157864 RepID=A0ABD2III8_9BILA